jgi:tetratricopeptide (TPR) repeat protein
MTGEELQKALDKANMLLGAGDFQKAYNAYKKVVKEHPDSAEAQFGLAESSLGIPKLTIQEIAATYQRACDLDPNNPLYFATYGNFCFENGILKKGEECFAKAAEIDEENQSVYLSDLATGYYHSAMNFRNHYPNMTDDDVLKVSLKYILMAFDLPVDKAKKLLDEI